MHTLGKTFVTIIVIATAIVTAITPYSAAYAESLGSFSTAQVGNFPKGWRTWPLQGDKAAAVYSVAEEGGVKYIKAYDDHDASQQIFYRFNWPIEDKPVLSWRWRATFVPQGARESDDNTNDSACSVYAVIGQYQGNAIKYVWSSQLAPGTVVTRHGGKLKIKVLDSGVAKKGTWISHSVDVVSDYEALFGQKLNRKPSGIAILTDGNAVHKPAGCDYTDFAISDRKP